MLRRIPFGRWFFPLLLAGSLTAGLYAAGPQELNGTQASPRLQSTIRLERMLLLLAPDAAKGKSLDTLLAAQQTQGNADFHQWLTAAQFADRFGVSAKDAETVVGWLKAKGFTVAGLPAGRGWIEFSGTSVQMKQAFGVPLKPASGSAGTTRYELAGAIQLPTAISGLVKGLVSLDGELSVPAVTVPAELKTTVEALAAETQLSKAEALTPSLAQSWLSVSALNSKATSDPNSMVAWGEGEAIAIPARSNVREEDFAAFRMSFSLPEMALTVNLAGNASADPGRTGEEAATTLAASWAGVAAPGAQIVLVPAASTNATDGVDLALAAIVDGAFVHTVSLGYSACESSLSPVHQAFYAALYRQAEAEGIAVVAAVGDSGAAACHLPTDTNPVTSGWGVNALASTPWNTAVGAVAFTSDGKSLTGWQPSAVSGSVYAPAYATGGGASTIYATPSWQSATGIPTSDPASVNTTGSATGSTVAHHRYLPDVSLPTAAGSSFGLAFCFAGETASNGCRLMRAGGSAASAAIFSGIAAVLAQKYGPEGNLAPNLYALSHRDATLESSENSEASRVTSNFVDIASGAAKLPCVLGSAGCIDAGNRTGSGVGAIGFDATAGYDLATGLGSVNVRALVANWAKPDAVGTAPVTVEETNTPGVTYNPSADITLTATVLSGSGGGVPTGTVQFYDETVGANTGTPVTLTSTGTASYTEDAQFTVGGHNIEAIYSGDGTYEAASSQPVTINVQPSPTSLTVTPSTTTPVGGATIAVTGLVTSTNLGNSPPTGTLTVNLDGIAQGKATLATTAGVTSGSVSVTVPSAGSHTVQGTYSGDSNYDQATSSSVTITVAKGATVTTIAATPSTLTAGVPETFTATMAPSTATTTAYTITGTVSFYDGGTTVLGTATISSNSAILTGIVLSSTASHTITAVYSGDTNWSASVSSPLLLQAILLPDTVTLTSSNSVLTAGQAATLTGTVTPVSTPLSTAEQHPTGNVYFYAGTTLIGESALAAGIGDTGVATVYVPNLPAASYVISAQYAGDTTYGPAVSNSLDLSIEDFTIGCSVNNLSVVQGQTATVACNVASLGGLAGPIQVVCAEQNPPQVGAMGCTFSPTIVNGTGQTTLTIVTTAGNIAENSRTGTRGPHDANPSHGPPLWPASGGVLLAFAGLLLSPIGKRAGWLRKQSGKLSMLALLIAGGAGAGLGCNSSSVTLPSNGGTPLGVHTLKITAAADVSTVTVSHYAFITVNVTP